MAPRRDGTREAACCWGGCFSWLSKKKDPGNRSRKSDPPKREDCADNDEYLDKLAIWNSEMQEELFLVEFPGFLQNFADLSANRAFFEIYKIVIPLHPSRLKISAKFR